MNYQLDKSFPDLPPLFAFFVLNQPQKIDKIFKFL